MENNIHEAFNMTHRDPDGCLGDLNKDTGDCTYIMRPYKICEELIHKYREYVLHDVPQVRVPISQYQ